VRAAVRASVRCDLGLYPSAENINNTATRIDLPNLFHTGDICLTRLRPDKPKITAVLGSTLPHLIDC
jgi:hypothetical protein